MAETSQHGQRMDALRKLMQSRDIDYVVVPSADPHHNEYVPACWQRRQWITGFTGSMGDALVGLTSAFLWVDSRYTLQAEQEVGGSDVSVMRLGTDDPSMLGWLRSHAMYQKIAVDPRTVTIAFFQQLKEAVESVGGELIALEENLIDKVWFSRPAMPRGEVDYLPERYTGEHEELKMNLLRVDLKESKLDYQVLTVLDQIAWIFNLRGTDIDYNPVFLAFAIFGVDAQWLFVDQSKLTETATAQLKAQNVTIMDYAEFGSVLSGLKGRVRVNDEITNHWVLEQLHSAEVVPGSSVIASRKAAKNRIERAGAHKAHHLDGVAVCRFLAWLHEHWQEGVTEVSLASKLANFRAMHPDYVGLSFPTISAFADHGAVVHYNPSSDSDCTVDDSSLFLLDSGGQYPFGTTDITRTLHLGHPTEEQRRLYTLTLKGHVALSRAVFPEGTRGNQLDTLARQFLWQHGQDYGHATGHGVGAYLCVHEGPAGISWRNHAVLREGMILSNEPGVYLKGDFGIRIENLMLIEKHEHGLCFESLTKVPYARNLIDVNLLTPGERAWIDHYHQLVMDEMAAEMQDPAEQSWLAAATAPL